MSSKTKIKPKKYHGFAVLIFILGTIFPPLGSSLSFSPPCPLPLTHLSSAVAARFGIGRDFWLNLFLTIAGYIPGLLSISSPHSDTQIYSLPGHVHNFYIQNIRNNKNHRRTPKWAQRYGLVDTTKIKRNEQRSQWAKRYNERLPNSALESQPLEDGQNPTASNMSLSNESAGHPRHRTENGELWNPEEEQYYGQGNGSSSDSRSSRWHYPANFDDAAPSLVPEPSKPKKKKKVKKDRFARTEDAYSISEDTTRRKKKKRSNRSAVGDDESTYSRGSGSTAQVPEDPEAGHYDRSERRGPQQGEGGARADDDAVFNHQF
jgi:uncharacterized membrane protein YqaE (UPF0057 family)